MSKSSEFPIVIVKNLPFNTPTDTLYELFGKYGNINQLRVPETSSQDRSNLGSCIIVYNNSSNAKRASSELNGINFGGRYLVSSLYSVDSSKLLEEDYIVRKTQLDELKKQYGIN